MKLSRHSIKRGEERLGLSVQAFERTARTALTLGISHRDTVLHLPNEFKALAAKLRNQREDAAGL